MRFWKKSASRESAPARRYVKQVHAPDPLEIPGKLPERPRASSGEMQARRQAAQGFVFVALVLIAGIYGTRLWNTSTEAARRKVCRQNLRVLAVALQMYAQDYDGRYPTGEGDLGRQLFTYLPNVRPLACPSDDLTRPGARGRPQSVRVPISYTYWPPRGANPELSLDVSRVPVLWDYNGGVPSGAHQEGGNILYLDGHTRWLPLIHWSAANQPW